MIPLKFDDIVYIVEDKTMFANGNAPYRQMTPLRKNTHFYHEYWCNNYLAVAAFTRYSRLHLFKAFNFLDDEVQL